MSLKQRCTGCGKRKELEKFDDKIDGKNGKNARCRPCRKDAKARSDAKVKGNSSKTTWMNGDDEIYS